MLNFKIFKTPVEVINWVNEEEALINIFSICNNEFSEFVMFYTIDSTQKDEEYNDSTVPGAEEAWLRIQKRAEGQR